MCWREGNLKDEYKRCNDKRQHKNDQGRTEVDHAFHFIVRCFFVIVACAVSIVVFVHTTAKIHAIKVTVPRKTRKAEVPEFRGCVGRAPNHCEKTGVRRATPRPGQLSFPVPATFLASTIRPVQSGGTFFKPAPCTVHEHVKNPPPSRSQAIPVDDRRTDGGPRIRVADPPGH